MTADEERTWEELHLLVDSLPVGQGRSAWLLPGGLVGQGPDRAYRELAEAGVVLELIRFGTYQPEADRWIRKAGPDHYTEHLPRLREWVSELAW